MFMALRRGCDIQADDRGWVSLNRTKAKNTGLQQVGNENNSHKRKQKTEAFARVAVLTAAVRRASGEGRWRLTGHMHGEPPGAAAGPAAHFAAHVTRWDRHAGRAYSALLPSPH